MDVVAVKAVAEDVIAVSPRLFRRIEQDLSPGRSLKRCVHGMGGAGDVPDRQTRCQADRYVKIVGRGFAGMKIGVGAPRF